MKLEKKNNFTLPQMSVAQWRHVTGRRRRAEFHHIEDRNSVFLGGIPPCCTPQKLCDELINLGHDVVGCSHIAYRSYGWAFVKMKNVKAAQRLIASSPIAILKRKVEVRPFLNRHRFDHCHRKPHYQTVIHAMIGMFGEYKRRPMDGITVAMFQTRLFRKFAYRLDGPEVLWIVDKNPTIFYFKKDSKDRICLIPPLSKRISKTHLTNKLYKMWRIVGGKYVDGYGDGYGDENCNVVRAVSITNLEEDFAMLFKTRIESRHFGYPSTMQLFEDMQIPQQLGIRLMAPTQSKESEAVQFAKGHWKYFPRHHNKSKTNKQYREKGGNSNKNRVYGQNPQRVWLDIRNKEEREVVIISYWMNVIMWSGQWLNVLL